MMDEQSKQTHKFYLSLPNMFLILKLHPVKGKPRNFKRKANRG